ncbi:MAG: 1-acyl-sn-glycerol-3-phosphate acyltransferase [Desulfobulbus sp.]|jgi:1-acyl-sn-glycerol-3-phosphate acyltransferase|uniref:lysophospholipid acyltransferase family protein n=1 Tax=Desulfobulbus sp. TaxID=895 RepID=UPI00283FC304|nr:lysophospholipid acyltransferase family protein [Desulfobulbus sp.]MDR2551175.1 1-acyl-sn-glycerol-3-phosphate acyltransferase [Desulfobulbus sp.]
MSPLQFIRSLCTLLLAPFLTLAVSVLSLIDLLWGRKSEVKAQVFPRYWGRILCRLAGVRVRVEGMGNIDPGQIYIFAGNHCSQYDIFSFQGYFPHDFRWIAKKELFEVPIFGQAMHRVGYIPIDRSHGRQALKSLDEAARRIAAGSSVLIFPEGTRSPDGTLHEFKTGAVMLAIKAKVPIVPLGFDGSYRVLPKGRLLPRAGEIVIRIGTPISTVHYQAADKHTLATELHAAVARLLAPGAGQR